MWIAIAAVALLTLAFAWALCRVAARADQHMEQVFWEQRSKDGATAAQDRAEDGAGEKERGGI